MGREILDPAEFSDFTFPYKNGPLIPIVESPLSYYPQTHEKPGYPSNPRMFLSRLYLQQGNWLNYYTGAHASSLSEALFNSLNDGWVESSKKVPSEHLSLFPQLCIGDSWPSTLLLHGTGDTAVPVEESRHLKGLLEKADVPVQLIEFEGQEHSFDYQPGSSERYKAEFDTVKSFLREQLG